MSTRGAIAIQKGDGWAGVYTHSDSYPSYRGTRVWRTIQDGTFRSLIESHPGGFSSFPNTPYPEHEPPMPVTSESPGTLFIEWVYILSTNGERLTILVNQLLPIEGKMPYDEETLRPDGFWDYGHCLARHLFVVSIPVNGHEPNWEEIEEMGRLLRAGEPERR